MKNLLVSTLLLIWFAAPSKGQAIYLEQDFASGTGTAYELIEAVTHLINNSAGSVDFVWERIVYDMPEEWSAPFCDKNNCYAPFTTTAAFNLVSGESGLLKPIFTPNEVEGIGTMKIRIYSITPGMSFDDTVTFQATTTGYIGINDIVAASSINIYPNITNSTFYITSDASIPAYYSIISASGSGIIRQNTLHWQFNKSVVDIAQLQAGLYHVVLFDRQRSLLATKQIVKL